MEILIKNGCIVNADSTQQADLLCKDGKIIKIGRDLKFDSVPDRIIDASSYYLFPGGIDPHVHMHLPTHAGYSSDDFLSGSKAALYGGTTTIIDFVTPQKGQSLAKAIEQRKYEAVKCLTDFSFHVSPIEWRDSLKNEISNCITFEGLRSLKVYMAYKESIGLDDETLFKVMKAVNEVGGMLTLHCEMGDEIDAIRDKFASDNKQGPQFHPLSRPANLEAQAVEKAIELSKKTNCPIYIVHVSTKESLKYIEQAQKNGQNVIAETCPQYLLLDESKYEGDFKQSSAFVLSPPLRKKEDQNALWVAIKNGTIQTIGTDHCPFNIAQKEIGINDFRKIPNGAGGVEHRLALLYTFGVLEAVITINNFVALSSTNVAKIFGLFPTKGVIAIGSDADILIWNPKVENTISVKTHHQNCNANIYEGVKTMGAPAFVIKNGNIVLENGVLSNNIQQGSFLKTNPF